MQHADTSFVIRLIYPQSHVGSAATVSSYQMTTMELTAAEAWTRVLERARTLLPEQTFKLWLEQTEPITLSQDVLTVSAGSDFAAEWIEDKYGDFLADLAERLFDRRLTITFEQDRK